MIIKQSILLSFIFSFPFYSPVFSQYSLALDLVPEKWQGNLLNPANFPKNKKLVLSFPHLQGGIQWSPFSLYKSSSKDSLNRIEIDLNSAIQSMDTINRVNLGTQINTFSIGFSAGENHWIALGHRFVGRAMIQFPKSLALLAYQGNKPFIGENVMLSSRLDALAYQELFLQMGFRWKTDPAISWGFKIKVLEGLTGVKTNIGEASIYTHPEDYFLTGKINYLVNTASINTSQPFANLGAAIDIGFQYQTEKSSFSGSIIDVGTILWKNAEQISLNKSITFEGLPLLDGGQSIDANFDKWVDSIKTQLTPLREKKSFTSHLPTKLFLDGRYSLSKSSHLNGYLFFEKYNKILHSTAGVGYLVTLNPWFDMGCNVQYHVNGRIQLSNHIGINIGNIACFASLENWNSLLSMAKKTQGINGQFGLNYVIKSNKSSGQHPRSKMNEKKFFRK
jgi:hypothetical protein